jgi:hypothetical protein
MLGPHPRMRVPRATPLFVVALLLALLGPLSLDEGESEAELGEVRSVYYVSTAGDDAAPGTLDAPFRTLSFALAKLRAGGTLVLRGGTYGARGLELGAAGTSDAPITLQAHPGEVPTLDGSFTEFRADPETAWEVTKEGSNVFRSAARYRDLSLIFGYLAAQDGGHALVPYESVDTLASPIEVHTDQPPFAYAGPGVAWNRQDRRIYVRLDPGSQQHKLGLNVPADVDPRRSALLLFPDETALTLTSAARHVVIEGLAFDLVGRALELSSGVAHVAVRGCTFRCGRYSIVVRENVSELEFDGCRFDGHFPPYVARSDVKEPENGRPAHEMQGAALTFGGRTEGVSVRRSTFRGLFDAIDAADEPVGFCVSHCMFEDIRDDVLQLGTAGHSIEFGHNVLLRVAVGPSWNGSGAAPHNAIGTKHFHHNVIDTSTPQLYSREDPRGLLPPAWQGPKGDGFAVGQPIGIHSSALASGPDPWKIYHNTFYFGADVDGGGAGVEYRLDHADRSVPHEVLNNVFVQLADHPILIGGRLDDGSQRYDGNLYFRVGAPSTPLFAALERGEESLDFDTLAALRADLVRQTSEQVARADWEAHGVEADPRLGSDHVPAADGPAVTGAVDLSQTGWPGTSKEVHRGALRP